MPESPLPKGSFFVETSSGKEFPARFVHGRFVVDDSRCGTEPSAPKCPCCSARETNRRAGAKDRPPEERKVCLNGDKCPFLRLGTCFFLHPNGPPSSEVLPPRYSRSVTRRRLRRRATARREAAARREAPAPASSASAKKKGGNWKTKKRRNQRRRAAAARKAGPTTAATANRRSKGPPSAPSADPVPPPVGPTRQAPKACPVSSPEKVTRRKRARVDSPIKQPTTLRVSAAVWCLPGSGNTSVRQQSAPLPQSATSVDQVAEPHASHGSMASISGGGITAAVSD